MQMGYNTDVEHRGVTVHIQTEDHGLSDSKITTQVFFSGRILDSRTISYGEAVSGIDGDEARDAEITRRMRAIHRHYLNRIREGVYDAKIPVESLDVVPREAVSTATTLTGQLETLADDTELMDEVVLAAQLAADAMAETPASYIAGKPEERAWRGIDNDFSADLATALRTALAL